MAVSTVSISGALGARLARQRAILAETADRGLEAGRLSIIDVNSRLTTSRLSLIQSDRHRLDLPRSPSQYSRIDRSEENLPARADVQDRHSRPTRRVAECPVDFPLRVDVGAVVGEQQIRVVMEQMIEQRPEQACDRRRRMRRLRSGRAPHAAPHRARSSRAAGNRSRLSSFTCSAVRPNRKKFSAPDLLANLDVGAVERADGERAVQRELHVAGAGRLLAGGRDLLREIGGRVDRMRVLHVEVRDRTRPSACRSPRDRC